MAILDQLGKYRNTGLLILRLGIGFMFILHGLPKITGGIEKWTAIGGSMHVLGISFLPVFWGFMAAIAETLGGLFLILGLFFRPACLMLFFTMFIASLMHLSKGDGIMGASHAIEAAILFIALIFIGPGKYSVDKR